MKSTYDVIDQFLSDIANKHNIDKYSLCIQIEDDALVVLEIEDDGYHNWLKPIETISK